MTSIAQLNRLRREPQKVITHPESVERDYISAVLLIHKFIEHEIEKSFEGILSKMEREEERTDAVDDVELTNVVEGIEVRIGETVSPMATQRVAQEIAEGVSSHNATELGRVLSINPNSGADQAIIDGFIRQNVSLITDLGRRATRDIREQIANAVANGMNSKELRALIQDRLGVSRSRARLIARDQVVSLHGQINRHRQTAAGVTHYMWWTANDERVRGRKTKNGVPIGQGRHWQLHNTKHSWDQAPEVTTKGKHEHPGGDYQCRCQAIPVIDFTQEDDTEEPEGQTVIAPIPRSRAPVAPSSPLRASPRAPRRPPSSRSPVASEALSLTQMSEVQARLLTGQSTRTIARDLGISWRQVKLVAQRLGLPT